MDARTVGKRLEALNNKAHKTNKEDPIAWRKVEEMKCAFQSDLDVAEVNLAVGWVNLGHEREGFILCWN